MKAILVREHGGPEKLERVDSEDAQAGPGEVLVRLRASSLNHLDLWVRKGIPGVAFPLPLIPGCDGAGTVEEIGPGVRGVERGQRVALQPGVSCGACEACLTGDDMLCRHYGILGEHRHGTHAELVNVPQANLIPIPDSLTFEEAAAYPLTFLTAWHMVVARARVTPGEWVLVHAGASGVSSAAIQIAKLFGARVITTVGSTAKQDAVMELGVEAAILYRETDFASEVRRITGKRGVGVIIDHVGEVTWQPNIRSLARGGRLVICGATSGFEPPTNLRFLFFKNLSLLGSTMGSKAELLQITRLVEQGKLKPLVHAVLPMEEIAEGHRLLEERRAIGKIVLRH